MDVSSLYGIAQNVLKNLGSIPFEEIASVWCFETELNKLKNIIKTLKDKILIAEERQADSGAVRDWLERLTTVVYAADDLFDEFNTVAERKELMDGNKVIMEVCTFCSPDNQVSLALKIYWNIKKIREKLDDIEEEGNMFEFLRGSPERRNVMSRRDQKWSYVDEEQVTGRCWECLEFKLFCSCFNSFTMYGLVLVCCYLVAVAVMPLLYGVLAALLIV